MNNTLRPVVDLMSYILDFLGDKSFVVHSLSIQIAHANESAGSSETANRSYRRQKVLDSHRSCKSLYNLPLVTQ